MLQESALIIIIYLLIVLATVSYIYIDLLAFGHSALYDVVLSSQSILSRGELWPLSPLSRDVFHAFGSHAHTLIVKVE